MRRPQGSAECVVSSGSVRVRIYHTPSRGRDSFTLSYYQDGLRKRPTFPTLKAAEREAKLVAARLGKSDSDVLSLRSTDRASYLRAKELLDPLNVPLETAAADYAEAKTRLGPVPLRQAVDFYLKRHPTALEPKTVEAVVEELLAAKHADGLSERYLESLRHYLGKFTRAFSCQVAAVTGRDLDRWIRSLGLSPRTRNNIRASLYTLFRFAVSRNYLPKDHDELDAVPVVKDRGGDIEVFTPGDMIEILEGARPLFIPFLALGAFAGIRHAEIQRLDWADIRFEDNLIEIHAGKAKTASRRTVPLLPNLVSWLRPHRESRGPVCPLRSVAFEIDQMVKRMNAIRLEKQIKGEFCWKHNALRHSFISYRLAQIQNTAQVALEAGNSPQMLFRHYRELVRPSDASAWFNIMLQASSPVTNGKAVSKDS